LSNVTKHSAECPQQLVRELEADTTTRGCRRHNSWGTAAAALPPFRPGNPALCGSRPL